MKILGGLIFWLVLTGLACPRAQAASIALEPPSTSGNMVLEVEGGRLTVKLADVPLETVVEEIGRQGHIAVTVQGPLRTTISLEFRQVPMEEALRRLLRGCGWMTVAGRNGTIEQLLVAETPAALNRSVSGGPPAPGQPGSSSGRDGGRPAVGQRPLEPVRAVAALMERDALKTFFDVLVHSPDDPTAMLDAFAKVVDSLSLEDVGDLLGMLRDKTMPLSKWEEALAPLADAVPAQERRALVRSLQDRGIRDVVLRSFEQVQLFKLAQAQEAQEAASR
jgi:hypothetical protein